MTFVLGFDRRTGVRAGRSSTKNKVTSTNDSTAVMIGLHLFVSIISDTGDTESCMKVLVADDSPVHRKLLDHLLVGWGYDVQLASDGNAALAILESESDVRLAIVDGAMPGLTGPELCKTIRTGNRPYVYIILLSANDRDGDIEHGFDLGADDYLCKPFKPFELRARLRVGMRILDAQKELLESRERLACQPSAPANLSASAWRTLIISSASMIPMDTLPAMRSCIQPGPE